MVINPNLERVQKILSRWGVASRRQAEKMILSGRVRLNGQIVHLGQKADLRVDLLEVDGQPIQINDRPKLVYLLLNKPAGVVCTCRDPQQRQTVIDLLPASLNQGQGIHPVGRLDTASTGALLLTNNGQITLRLTHPRYHLPKNYHVWVAGNPPESVLDSWRQGIILSGQKTLPAQVKILRRCIDKTLLEVILKEGRNRQIRRVAEQLGYQVLHLHRTAIGSIKLKSANHSFLKSGQYRYLAQWEVDFLRNQAHLTQPNINVPADKKEHLP